MPGETSGWIAIAVLTLLIIGIVVARDRIAWRWGALLLAVGVAAIATVEALVRAEVLSAGSSGAVVAAIAVALVLAASAVSRARTS